MFQRQWVGHGQLFNRRSGVTYCFKSSFKRHSTRFLSSSNEAIAMVYYFKSSVVDPPAFLYVGKDKEESTALT
jgi:hypothetical protein